ncbi:MAG: FAD-dependent oxidoreductase, partial [Motiliproteus sp.]|nr:FAD-dependent oxidoreductase [Motiliproteus sp.]
MNITAIRPQKIAVIGTGISGLSCAWMLDKAHQVTLFEKDDRLGGHSNTVNFDLNHQEIAVDTGFIVYNPRNYPNLVKLFDHLDVENCETDMSFAVSIDDGRLEYAGTNLSGLFAQRRNLVNISFWKMVTDLLRFYRQASHLSEAQLENISLGELLQKHGYGRRFIHDHLLPMGAAIWSTPAELMLQYPAATFLRFCRNHGLVQVKDRPQWRTVIGGSVAYINRLMEEFTGEVRLNSRIHRVHRPGDKVIVEDLHGRKESFDHAVFACHADQALSMLDQPSSKEQQLLSCFPYQRNQAFLHLDSQLMPKRRKVWASWNYLSNGHEDENQNVAVSYWMNRLQPLATETPVIVSLNPLQEPVPGTIIRSFLYDHPLFDQGSIDAQKKLWQLQGQQNSWFCGSYFGYGFHEDGLQSGLAVAEQL